MLQHVGFEVNPRTGSTLKREVFIQSSGVDQVKPSLITAVCDYLIQIRRGVF